MWGQNGDKLNRLEYNNVLFVIWEFIKPLIDKGLKVLKHLSLYIEGINSSLPCQTLFFSGARDET